MEKFAAGIIPYFYFENEIYFLLGYEKSNNKWSGFVGGSELYESITQTAIREFNEETSLVFKDYLNYFESKCVNTPPIIEKTPTGKNVYLLFVESTPDIFFTDLDQLGLNQTFIHDPHYREKSKLKWFSLYDISRKKNILYRLKQTILKNF